MSDGPWIKFYPSDWLTGTRGLSAAETGVYITLIAMMYEKGVPIILDSVSLSRLCGIPIAPFRKIIERLVASEKITQEGGGIFNSRVKSELATRQKTSVAASKSALKRWGKDKENQQSVDADAMRETSIARAGQISDIRSQKESTQTDILDGTSDSVGRASPKRASGVRGTRLPRDWVLPKPWGQWALDSLPGSTVDLIRSEAEKFRDYWVPKVRDATKLDWELTWHKWIRTAWEQSKPRGSTRVESAIERQTARLRERIENEHGIGRQEDRGVADVERLPLLDAPHRGSA